MLLEKYLNIRFSLKNLTDEEFEKILPDLADELFQLDYKYSYSDKQLMKSWEDLRYFSTPELFVPAQARAGMKVLEHFMPNVWDVENFKGVSFAKLWTKENLIKALRFNRQTHSTPYLSELRRGIYFTTGLVKTTMYRPTLAKMIADKYAVTNLLDPCIGWGGRMLGTSISPFRKYIGFEPNTETFKNLVRMKEYLKLDNVEIYNEPAETGIDKVTEKVDAILTSPPYFNLEIYSKETTQSMSYGTYEEWLNKFMFVVIEKSVKLLSDSGVSCWNVANFSTDNKYDLVGDIVKIHNSLGYTKINELYVASSKKPTGNIIGAEKNKDITMVFSKQCYKNLNSQKI